jgi:hypothetical protein
MPFNMLKKSAHHITFLTFCKSWKDMIFFLVPSAAKMPSHGPVADDIVVKALQTLIGKIF